MFGRTGLIAAAFLTIGAITASAQTETAVQPVAVNAAPSPTSRTISTSYDATWTGISTLHINVAVRLTPETYSATANLKPAGLTTLTGHLRKSTTYKAQSRGSFKDSGVTIPEHYNHRGGKKKRLVEIDFNPTDVTVTANPIFGGMGDPPASPAQRLEAIDSLSAIVSLISTSRQEACTRDLKIFDGRARYNLDLTPAGTETIKVGGFSGTATKCTIAYKRIAGFEKKKDEKPLLDKPVLIWFAPTSNGLMAPAKITVDSNWGPITITLKSMAVT